MVKHTLEIVGLGLRQSCRSANGRGVPAHRRPRRRRRFRRRRGSLDARRRCGGCEPYRAAQLATIRSAHRIVIGGLAILFATGLLLFAADVDTFLPSKTFWLKIGLRRPF